MLKSPVVEPHPLQLFTYEPDTDNAGNFIVVGNIGINGIDRHGGPPDFKTTRSPDLKWGILIPSINTGRLGCTATQVAAERRGNQGPSTPALRAT